jgi:hypothetical protein
LRVPLPYTHTPPKDAHSHKPTALVRCGLGGPGRVFCRAHCACAGGGKAYYYLPSHHPADLDLLLLLFCSRAFLLPFSACMHRRPSCPHFALACTHKNMPAARTHAPTRNTDARDPVDSIEHSPLPRPPPNHQTTQAESPQPFHTPPPPSRNHVRGAPAAGLPAQEDRRGH